MTTPDVSNRSRGSFALATFVVLTFGWTWSLWTAGAALPAQQATVATVLIVASAFGPGLAGVATVALFDGLAGVKWWSKRCLHWRIGWGWYAIAAIVPVGVMAMALALYAAMGSAAPPSPAMGNGLLVFLIFVQILVLGGPLGEEFGWRGYALPALTERMGWRWASLCVGLAWAFWHLPLFWMPGMAQANLPMVPFLASTVALSVVFARLSVNTRFSVLPAIVLHWSVNAGSWVIPVTPQGGVTQPYFLVVGLLVVIAAVVFLKPGPHPSPQGLQQ